jgi:hypothetical protein
MKALYVGTYPLCAINTDVYIVDDWSSSFNAAPDPKSRPVMSIGGRQKEWWKILDSAIHEAYEMALVLFGHAYTPARVSVNNSTTYVFQFDHGEFVSVTEEVSYFLAKVLPDLAKAWVQFKKGAKK